MPGPKYPKLSPKQERFVEEYVIDCSAAAAARRAGYAEKYADRMGYRLLATPLVAAALAEKKKNISKRNEATVDRIVQELARIAFQDPRRLFNENGSLKDPKDLDDDTAAALSTIESAEEFDGSGADRKLSGYLKKIKGWDKLRALELLGKYLGIFVEKLDINAKMEVESRDRELEALLAEDPEARKLAAELYQRAAARRLAGAGPD